MKNLTKTFEAFNELFTQHLKPNFKVKNLLIISDDNHAQNRLKDNVGINLVLTYPSKNLQGASDEHKEISSYILFVLEKDNSGQTHKAEFEQFCKLENIANFIVEYFTEQKTKGCSFFCDLEVQSIHVEPEYRSFGGWNGWAISFNT